MAGTSGILSSSEQIQANYEKYKSKFKDATEKMVNSDTFLSLLVAEMTNQDPMEPDRKSTRLNSSHDRQSRMPSSA